MLRLLVPLVTIVVLLGRGVTAFAGAGIQLDVKCCCPDPRTCKCHDHGGGERTTIKKCSGAFHQVAPEQAVTAVLATPPPIDAPRATPAVIVALAAPIVAPTREPETPPF